MELTPSSLARTGTGPEWKMKSFIIWKQREIKREYFNSDAADPDFKTCCFTPDIEYAALCENSTAVLADGWSRFCVLDITRRKIKKEFSVPVDGDQMEFDCIVLSPDASRCAVGRRLSVMIWNLASGRHFRTLEESSHYYGHKMFDISFFSRDLIWYACSEGIYRMNLTCKDYYGEDANGPLQVDGAAFHAGAGLVLAVEDKTLHLFRAELPLEPLCSRELDVPIPVLAFSPSGKLIAVCSGESINIFSTPDLKPVLSRKVTERGGGHIACGFVNEDFILCQYGERLALIDIRADRLSVPSLSGHLLFCRNEMAVMRQGDCVYFWKW